MLRLGYNTNGFAHHRLEDALEIIAEIGYRCAAVTMERQLLDPPSQTGVAMAVDRLAPLLERTGLRATIETGTRFILDPRRKHQPTLISAARQGRARRVKFIQACVEVAAAVGAESVSLWSGTADDAAEESVLFDRLHGSLNEILEVASKTQTRLSFEPEPGMFIDTMERFAALLERVDHPLFGLTIDVGHLLCLDDSLWSQHPSVHPNTPSTYPLFQGERGFLGPMLSRWKDRLYNVHLEDMRRGVHEHLMFGEGDIDFGEVLAELRAIRYDGPVHVELSRHSHDAVEAARRSFEFLRELG